MVKSKLQRSGLMHSILIKMGFHRCNVVPCLYIRGTPDSDDYMLVCVHVDDGYIVSKSEGAIDTFIIDLMKEIHNATLCKPCQKYVGMEIVPDGNHVFVHQNTYIKSLKFFRQVRLTGVHNGLRYFDRALPHT